MKRRKNIISQFLRLGRTTMAFSQVFLKRKSSKNSKYLRKENQIRIIFVKNGLFEFLTHCMSQTMQVPSVLELIASVSFDDICNEVTGPRCSFMMLSNRWTSGDKLQIRTCEKKVNFSIVSRKNEILLTVFFFFF